MGSVDCWCDGDPPVLYNRSTPRARKQYRCYECAGSIHPGDRYERVDGMWDRSYGFDTFVTCRSCHDLRQWVQNNVPCLCWSHGNMIEDCQNAVMDAIWRAPTETTGLRFGFSRRLHAREARKRLERRRVPTPPPASEGESHG